MIALHPASARGKTASTRNRSILPVFLAGIAAALLLAGCVGSAGDARARVKGQWDMGTGMTRSR